MSLPSLRPGRLALAVGYSGQMIDATERDAAKASNRYRFVIYALLVGMNFVLGIAFLGPASLLPLIIDDYRISRAFAGFISAGMTVMVMTLSIPVGVLGSRWGLKRSLTAGWLLVGAGVLVPLLPGALPLAIVRVVQGLGAATLPLAAAVLMRWAPRKEFPAVNAATLASLTAGTAASLMMGPFLAGLWSWQSALGFQGALSLAGALFWMALAKEGPPGSSGDAQAVVRVADIAAVFRLRTTWLLAFAVTGPWAVFMALSSWLPTYYTEVRGLDLNVAAFTVAVFTIAGIPAALVGGVLTSRTGHRRPILMWAGVLLAIGAIVTVFAPAGLPLYLAVALTGMVQWAYEPAIFTLPLELPGSTPERAGAVTAAMVSVGNGTSFVAPVLVGFLRDATGSYVLGLTLVSASALTLFVAALFLPETGPGRVARVSRAESGTPRAPAL